MKNIFFANALALLLVCPSFAQGAKTPAQPPVKTKVRPKQNVRIILSTKATKYAGNDDVYLEITLENLEDTGFGIPDQEVEDFYQIQLVGPTSDVPQTPKRGARMHSGGYFVPAHGKLAAYVWLNHMFDLSKIGKYTVKVSTNFDFDKINLDATSEPLTFEITSPPTLSGWHTP